MGPILSNRKTMWIGAFGFALLHGLWTVYKVIFSSLVDFHRDYVDLDYLENETNK